MSEKVGLLGGSFNPVHIGHLLTARAVAESLGLSRVVLIPCARPPHKWPHELAGMHHRLEMARLAAAGQPWLQVSDVEAREDGLTYPIHAIVGLQAELGGQAKLHWIIGCDAVADLCNWHRLDDMVASCEIVIATRAGFDMPDLTRLQSALSDAQVRRLQRGFIATPQLEISATQIRQRVEQRRSIRYFTPDAVCDYIADHGLYVPRSPSF